jgi:predicted acetyltransferase
MPTPAIEGHNPGDRNSSTHSDSGLVRGSPAAGATAVGAGRSESLVLRELGSGARIVTGNASDHQAVLQLLVQARQAALADDFQSRLDAPGYCPNNRLLIRRGSEMLGQAHVDRRIAWFEGQRVPVAIFEDFEVLPEYRGTSFDESLLSTADSIAMAEGAVLALALTDQADWFRRQGWSQLVGQGHTRAGVAAVLAHLDAQEQVRGPRRAGIHVRTWRHYEMDQIREVYDQAANKLWGPLVRSEQSWQWLVGRKAQDQVLVAVHKPKANSSNETVPSDQHGSAGEAAGERIVGYAMLRGSCIVELMTLRKFSSARVKLLARACREAMDRDHHWISLYTPASDPLHELLVTAGGQWVDERHTPTMHWMMRLLSPEKWVERCYALWGRRARAAAIPRPFEIGISLEDACYRFTLTRRSSRLQASTVEGDVQCDRPAFESLLVGNLPRTANKPDPLRFDRPELQRALNAIFPTRLFWQSALELTRL